MFKDYYRNKKVFVTGHTGFKGSWLSTWLVNLGAEVCGYSLAPSTNPNLFEVNQVGKYIKSIIGDIRDEDKLASAMNEFKPQIVFHLAAQPIVNLSYEDPVGTYATNVTGIVNLFEAIRKTESVKSCVIITSDKCYENKEWLYGYRENDELGGYDPYSASKACAEIITSSYRRSFFRGKERDVKIATVRAGNVIGGGDWSPNRLIPDCFRSFAKKEKVSLRYPMATRPWQHVLEPLSGYLTVGSKLEADDAIASAWNFGPAPTQITTVEEVVRRIVSVWGDGASYDLPENAVRHHEAGNLVLDVSKAFNYLGWKQVWDLSSTIEKTTNWYKNYLLNPAESHIYTEMQIKQYSDDAKTSGLPWVEA